MDAWVGRPLHSLGRRGCSGGCEASLTMRSHLLVAHHAK